MANPKTQPDLIALDDYLEGEKVADVKHEFVNGMVYAMAGGSVYHDTIAGNIAAALNAGLPDTCRATVGNVQLGLRNSAAGTWFHYPDVFVFCGETNAKDFRRDDALVIFEVLSPSTERMDRYEKFERSKTLPTLQEYVLVEQSMPRFEIYRRTANWKQEFFHPDASLLLASVGQTLTFEQVYRRVSFETEQS
jgi:Uma2 family endonuclease